MLRTRAENVRPQFVPAYAERLFDSQTMLRRDVAPVSYGLKRDAQRIGEVSHCLRRLKQFLKSRVSDFASFHDHTLALRGLHIKPRLTVPSRILWMAEKELSKIMPL